MIGGLLRLVSTAATVFVVLGFALFAIDETRAGSAESVARLDGATPAERRAAEEEHDGLRGTIDEVNDVLLAPFDGVVAGSDSAWVRHGVPAVLGFLLYGLGLRLLANVAPQGRRPHPVGWDAPR